MNPDQATARQIEAYRAMTGEQRLAIGLGLYELSCAVARDGNRQRYPDASPQIIDVKLRQRIRLGYTIAAKLRGK